jgi:excisionase family DNA binding protein
MSTAPAAPTVWLTCKEASVRAHVCRLTLRRAVAAGEIPAYRIGRGRKHIRFRLADVDAWVSAEPILITPAPCATQQVQP